LEKTRDEVITTISRAYDQLALIHQSKIVLDESKRDWMPTEKQQIKL
jgi:hypothetical protein